MKVLINPKTEYTIRLNNEYKKRGIESIVLTTFELNAVIPLIIFRLYGYKILHLNFFYVFPTYFNQILVIGFARLLGYKIVFTVHNISTHEKNKANKIRFYELLEIMDFVLIHYNKNLVRMSNEKIDLELRNYEIIFHPIW